ncbi:MAG: hypothetical protein M1829_002103 [Trizodia sp. TS-e1964]|nr:MAG: hypothetical protein M1829_002103 [Trizodia sp. TS-e1964]
MASPTQTEAFDKAAGDSRKLKAKPTDSELLQLYAFYKQGMQKPPIEEAENPGTFDLKGKAKKRAWQKLVDEGVTKETAITQYIALVEKLKTAYGFDAEKEPETIGAS